MGYKIKKLLEYSSLKLIDFKSKNPLTLQRVFWFSTSQHANKGWKLYNHF